LKVVKKKLPGQEISQNKGYVRYYYSICLS
jgi:hypothetical protein